MTRLFTLGGVCIDVAATLLSSATDFSDVGLATWISLNALLLVLPITWQIADAMLTAADAPEILTLEEYSHVG